MFKTILARKTNKQTKNNNKPVSAAMVLYRGWEREREGILISWPTPVLFQLTECSISSKTSITNEKFQSIFLLRLNNVCLRYKGSSWKLIHSSTECYKLENSVQLWWHNCREQQSLAYLHIQRLKCLIPLWSWYMVKVSERCINGQSPISMTMQSLVFIVIIVFKKLLTLWLKR